MKAKKQGKITEAGFELCGVGRHHRYMEENSQKRWALRIIEQLESEGFKARFAGGCVRDELLGKTPHDYDVATTAKPEQVQTSLGKIKAKLIPTGIEHGTVTAVRGKSVAEITTLRADVSTDGRRATVAFTDSFEVDASRRDFTVNSMYMDRHGKVFDYFNGKKDIAANILRFVGEPEKRIKEDYLRVLRLFRFVSQHGFAVEASSLSAAKELAKGIDSLSGERVWSEVKKTLSGNHALIALELMHGAGLTAALFGVAGEDPKRVAAASAWKHENKEILLWGRAAVFFPTKQSLATWKMSAKERSEILSFVDSVAWLGNSAEFDRKKLGFALDETLGFESVVGSLDLMKWAESLDRLEVVQFLHLDFEWLKQNAKSLEPLRVKQLPVNGNEMLELAESLEIKVKGKSIGNLFRILRSGYYMGHWQSKIDGLRVLKTLLEDGEDETF